jgi:glycosyltransferase involved in cell wall biosynthesis
MDLSRIPTTDSQEALIFCQALSQALAKSRLQDLEGGELHLPVLSVVIPIYNEEENLQVLYDKLTEVLEKAEPDYELVLINDGSKDRSSELLQDLALHDGRLTVVDLSRNFGHQIAISAGLDFARGQAVAIMDADLQDPPEVLPLFIEKWREGHDVVYAVRKKRKEGIFKHVTYKIFYRLLRGIANIEIPLDAGDFCIMDRRVVDLLVRMPERNRFVRGIRTWVGFDQVGLAYERQARYGGRTKYSFTKLMYLALDGLVSFSYLPLRIISILGLIVSAISVLTGIAYIIQRLIFRLSPPGFATIIVGILFLGGVQLITLGVIGEYIGRIFEEVKSRPLYIVRRVTGSRVNANLDVR